jgi:hypothetical protein
MAATSGEYPDFPFQLGICSAADRYFGMPAHVTPGARVTSYDPHGFYLIEDLAGQPYWAGLGLVGGSSALALRSVHTESALHRAMTCYLVAEMVMDGRAPAHVAGSRP